MIPQNTNQTENTVLDRVNTLIAELEINGAQKKGYLKTAKNNPQLVIDQLEAYKQYQADFNNEFVELFTIDTDGI